MRTRIASWTSALLAAALVACGTATSDVRQSLTGHYEASLVDRGQRESVTLDCPGETHCTFAIPAAGPPIEATEVHPVADPKEARFALGYAVEHADVPPSPDGEPFAARLATLLHASPDIATCWELQDHGYLLACRLRAGGRPDPRMFVFGTILAGCGPRTCRYEIIPLDEKRR